MTPLEIKQLIKALRKAGVTRYKSPEIELDLGPLPPRRTKEVETQNGEIPHVVSELTSLMKLGDNELAERLFPDTEEQKEDDDVL